MEDWWLDELQHAGSEHLTEGLVADYDQKQQFDPTTDLDLLRSYGFDASSTILDLGAGTGTFALAAADAGATVYAVDVSPAMISALRGRSQQYPNLHAIQSGLLSFQHSGAADFVYTRNALHHLPDFWKVMALRGIRRWLRPGGILLIRDIIYDTDPDGVEADLEAWLTSAPQDPSSGYTRSDLVQHINSEFSTFSWLLEEVLRRTGFSILDKTTRRSVFVVYTCRQATHP